MPKGIQTRLSRPTRKLEQARAFYPGPRERNISYKRRVRKLIVGKRHILFKKTSPKNLAAAGLKSGLVIQALKEIGDGNIKAVEERKTLDILEKESHENLKKDLAIAPE